MQGPEACDSTSTSENDLALLTILNLSSQRPSMEKNMADQPIVHIGENSAEEVAYKLLKSIAASEAKQLVSTPGKKADVERKWLLDTYAECLDTVKGNRIYARN